MKTAVSKKLVLIAALLFAGSAFADTWSKTRVLDRGNHDSCVYSNSLYNDNDNDIRAYPLKGHKNGFGSNLRAVLPPPQCPS